MANVLQLVLSQPNSGMEDAFNAWYGGSHLLHGVETPGVLSGQRFRRAASPLGHDRHDYLMIWEMDDPAFALAELAKVKGGDRMPISPAIDMTTVQPPTFWRRAEVRSRQRIAADSARFGPVVVSLHAAVEGEDVALEAAMLSGGLVALADLSGVRAAEYLTLAVEQIRGNCRKFPHGLLVELHDEAAALPALAERLAALPHADPARRLAALFHPLGDKLTKAEAARTAEHA